MYFVCTLCMYIYKYMLTTFIKHGVNMCVDILHSALAILFTFSIDWLPVQMPQLMLYLCHGSHQGAQVISEELHSTATSASSSTFTSASLKAGIHGATSCRFVACNSNEYGQIVPQIISKLNNYGTFTHIHSSCMRQVGRKSPRVCRP